MVTYNKEFTKSDGRKLVSNGPRDLQRRASTYQQEIMMLKEQIMLLQSYQNDCNTKTGSVGISQDQLNDIINKTTEEVYLEVDSKYAEKVSNLLNERDSKQRDIETLREEIKRLNSKLDDKDKMIIDLTTKIGEISSRPITVVSSGVTTSPTVQSTTETKRPEMDKVYIDPSKKGAEDEMKSHVKIKEVKNEGESNVGSSVNKLKSLMGKLPKK